jgi:hypothetical protein
MRHGFYILLWLFNDAIRSSDYILLNGRLERMWKEVVVSYSKVESRYSPGGAEESQENPQDSGCPGRNSNRKPSELKSEALSPRPYWLVRRHAS